MPPLHLSPFAAHAAHWAKAKSVILAFAKKLKAEAGSRTAARFSRTPLGPPFGYCAFLRECFRHPAEALFFDDPIPAMCPRSVRQFDRLSTPPGRGKIGHKLPVTIQMACIMQRIGNPFPENDGAPRRKIGNIYARQAVAAGKRGIADGNDAARDRHARQPVARIERIIPDGRDTVWDDEIRHELSI